MFTLPETVETDISNALIFLDCYLNPNEAPFQVCYHLESYRYSCWNYFTELLGEVDPVLAA